MNEQSVAIRDVEAAENRKGFEMKTSIVVLCWLAVAILVAGCTTGKHGVKQTATAGQLRTIRKMILPVQKAGLLPFDVRVEMSYSPRSEKELVPAMVACEYLEAAASAGQLPLRVREGLIIKREGQWQLAELPFEKGERHGCLPPFIHYAVWRRK